LATLGSGMVAPNPLVGAVLVNHSRIIGEGYHAVYGQAHAEVNCLASVAPEDRKLIKESTLYVSLEPCTHYGKTPPCTDLIIREGIPKVFVGNIDPFPAVNGRGLARLANSGVETKSGILEREGAELNKRFFTFYNHRRPYVILKWAQTGNGRISSQDGSRLHITGPVVNRIVHKWRAEESAILVGTRTATTDDPRLTVRFWRGNNPIRIVIDLKLKLNKILKIFDNESKTLIINYYENKSHLNLTFIKIEKGREVIPQILEILFEMKIQSLIVEGGRHTLQAFIDFGIWDEARTLTNHEIVSDGIGAPALINCKKYFDETIGTTTIEFFRNLGGEIEPN